ncbi:unnamed protein product [Rotaria magnacalcarata]|uniref:Uncharacterized protein n=1 Tax=Rotaria magnacalcarata TaxID=392030 RepID=A0A816UPP8_9BILA|nr:unnamed protein product [Rotaria magnacalcarata]
MSTSFNFDYLPADTILGEPEANLLNKISIKSTTTLIQTEDPLDIFNYDIDDEELETLKDELSFKLKNKKFLLKPGVISGFRSLKEALKRKVDEQLTKSKGRKQQHQQQLFSTSSSSIYSLVPAAPAPTQAPSTSNPLSLAEHRTHVLKLITKWCSDNKENFDLENFELEENVDFILNIDFDEHTNVKASIKCKCNKVILLGKNDNKIQVSNYYKHLQSNGCDHMKNIKKLARKLTLSQQQQRPSTPITLAPSYRPHASLIEIASVSPTDTQTRALVDSSALPNQAVYNGAKRRLTSESQQHRSTKRSRV